MMTCHRSCRAARALGVPLEPPYARDVQRVETSANELRVPMLALSSSCREEGAERVRSECVQCKREEWRTEIKALIAVPARFHLRASVTSSFFGAHDASCLQALQDC